MIRTLRRLLIIALLGTGIGWAGLRLNRPSGETTPEYRTEPVTRETIIRQVTASGRLLPAVSADVNSQIPGVVQEVLVDFGAQVVAGQSLVRLEPAMHQAFLNEAIISLANARKALGLAQRRVEQARTLQAQGLVAQIDLEKSLAELEQAEGVVRMGEAAVERATIDLERCTVRAPIDGVVISRNVEVGQTAGAGALPLFVLASDLRRMNVEASVSEADVGYVRRGQEVRFTVDAFPDMTFPGKVALIRNAVSIDQSVVTYPTVITTDNPRGDLKPGMTANVAIILARREDTLTMASKALRFTLPGAEKRGRGERPEQPAGRSDPVNKDSAERAVVYRLPAGGSGEGAPAPVPEAVSITIGLSDGGRVEVVDGLSEGDQLVVGIRTKEEQPGFLAWLPELLTGSKSKDEK